METQVILILAPNKVQKGKAHFLKEGFITFLAVNWHTKR